MTVRLLLLAALIHALVETPAVADDCGAPAPTCGQRICSYVTTFVDANITAVADDSSSVTLTPIAFFGETPAEIAVGVEVTISQRGHLDVTDVGQRRYVYVHRDSGTLIVTWSLDPAHPAFVECFGEGATTETIAATVLEPDCSQQLAAPESSCDQDTCNAGGGKSAMTLAVLAAFVIVPRRRRHGGCRVTRRG
jgi:uncharacterized protein (TIGR03382 family)